MKKFLLDVYNFSFLDYILSAEIVLYLVKVVKAFKKIRGGII